MTKKIHNGLQGADVELSEDEREAYLVHSEANAVALEDRWDVVVTHDPQPAAVRSFVPEAAGAWLWRCHVDTSEPHPVVWDFIRPYVKRHDSAA